MGSDDDIYIRKWYELHENTCKEFLTMPDTGKGQGQYNYYLVAVLGIVNTPDIYKWWD